ncbi:mitochondrial carrier [Fragilariopsis cylindrus CCMP1102]|uniref:Mitochondrial carrier n=1 Tax=Fragilariopsis cylindrus CCMP1102 TaxID=635003 RepID=A0A1E7EY14_9STRA|nr:mitochondrial carrier [Fragilariopsis cylindrus CCMP1102]|eukprot:OEU10724.1 mitochondrial carrier [Fragilariopsis cylindrus CCMP1102]
MNTLPTTPTSFTASGNHHIHRVNTKTNPAHSMFAGWLAGFSGTIVGYPLDSAKVWLQTNTMGKNKYWGGAKASSPGSNKGLNDNKARNSSSACAKISTPHQNNPIKMLFRTVRALYSGASSPFITVGMVQSVNFATYDATRQFLYRRQQQQNDNYIDSNSINNREYLTQDSLAGVAISGSVAGMVTGILTAPLIMIKINQQITGNPFRVALKETFALKQSQHQQGRQPRLSIISGFRFRPYGAAFIPHIFSESISRAMYVATYEGLKRHLLLSKQGNNYDVNINNNNNMNMNGIVSLSLQERMMCAASSGVLCWAVFFPFDALRSRMYYAASHQKQQQQQQQQHHLLQKQPQQQSYKRSFYRGFSISLLRAGPVAAAVLPVYDLTLERLSSSSY